jgi:hypothetical protein
MLCKYRDLFGVPGQGLHSIRLFNIALIDTLSTLLLGVILAYYFRLNVLWVWFGLFVAGILVHRLFCVNSTVNTLIFGRV